MLLRLPTVLRGELDTRLPHVTDKETAERAWSVQLMWTVSRLACHFNTPGDPDRRDSQ